MIDPKPGEPTHVTIATTRPETMLGDTAVAVHPDPAAALDQAEAELREKLPPRPRKKRTTSKTNRRPWRPPQGGLAELVQLRDMATARRDAGTPAHRPQDSAHRRRMGQAGTRLRLREDHARRTTRTTTKSWQRNPEIGVINILNPDGTLNESVPEKYRGLTMKKAREAVVADIEAARPAG